MPEPNELRFEGFERLVILNQIIPQKAQSIRDITTSHNLRLKLKPTEEEQDELQAEGAPEGQLDLSRLLSGDFTMEPHEDLTEREIDFLIDCVVLKEQQDDLPNTEEMYGILMGGEDRTGLVEFDEDERLEV